jgi:hypothetical protein
LARRIKLIIFQGTLKLFLTNLFLTRASGIEVPYLIEIIKSRLKMRALPPQLQKQLEAKMGEYPNPLVAIETADQMNALGE